jgi:hypothetical protein
LPALPLRDARRDRLAMTMRMMLLVLLMVTRKTTRRVMLT